MRRHIDANNLIQKMRSRLNPEHNKITNDFIRQFIKEIEDEPTSFDEKRLIEELDKHYNSLVSEYNRLIENPQTGADAIFIGEKLNGVAEATDIVKNVLKGVM